MAFLINDKENSFMKSEAMTNRRYNLRSKIQFKYVVIHKSSLQNKSNIFDMFHKFNHRFFWGSLTGVKLEFSDRLKKSAGICSYLPNDNFCCIRLSNPLLSLRPRSDVVNTLLHEMIHAYLRITKTGDCRSHGPEFHKHMYRINKIAGTNITVYHNFHKEVELYEQHWWKCNGPCKNWDPFYGMVKRSVNRAPGPADSWWHRHLTKCGGKFTKIREPVRPTHKIGKKLLGFKNLNVGLGGGIYENRSNFELPSLEYRPNGNIGLIEEYVDLTSPSESCAIVPHSSISVPCPICAINVYGNLSIHISECLHKSGILKVLNESSSLFESNNRSMPNENHIRTFHIENSNNLCPVCGVQVMSDLKSHLEGGCLDASGILDEPDVPLQNLCPVCGAQVMNDLKSHLESGCLDASGILDDLDVPWKNVCPVCDVQVMSDLKSHLESGCLNASGILDEPDVPLQHFCPVCGAQVMNDLKSHLESGCLDTSGILDELDVPFDVNIFECIHHSTEVGKETTVSTNTIVTESNNSCRPITTCPICLLDIKCDIKYHVSKCLSSSGLFDD